jgi:hypothetical protein
MVAKAFRPSAARRPDPGRGEGTEHKWSRNRRRAAPSDSRRERQSQFASPARRSQAMVAKAFRPSAARRPDPGPGEGTEHKWSRNRRRAAPSDSRRERQSQFASPARRSQAMVAKAFRPSAARRPDPGRGKGSGHKRSRNQRRGAPRDSWRERQSQFAPPARRRTVTPKVTPTNAAASSTASRLQERCAASPRIIVSKDDLALSVGAALSFETPGPGATP